MLERVLDAAINFHLVVNQTDNIVNHFVGGHAEILWCSVVGVNHARDRRRKEWLATTGILHEV